jgi:AraC family transcriptional regulator
MGAALARVMDDEGVLVRSADVNGFTLAELDFPPGYVQTEYEPDLPYLALVLEGGLQKSFRRRTIGLERASGLAMPVGAAHGARFGPQGARILIVKCRSASTAVPPCLLRLADVRGPGLTWLAWRLAGELRASDAAAPLAAEGFALELLAAASRELADERQSRRPPRWLASAEELLRARIGDRVSLGELAAVVGVHPAHLARAFRARYGVSVGEYGRRLRLEWATAEIARGDIPLAMIATQAGFADQSHFTRLFKLYVGMTPARYREHARRA